MLYVYYKEYKHIIILGSRYNMAEVQKARLQYKPSKIESAIILDMLAGNPPLYPVNMGLPNINIPNNLMPRRFGTNESQIKSKVRELLNTVTKDTINASTNKLRAIIDEESKERGKNADVSMLKEIAQEFLDSFLVAGQRLNEYLHLLNSIHLIAIKESIIQDSKEKIISSKTIGAYIIDFIKEKYMIMVDENNIRTMAMRNMDDPDEQDIFFKDEEKIINIITLICALYNQRDTTFIRLNITHIIIVFNKLLGFHSNAMKLLSELDEDDDEEEYDIRRRMASIYEKMMYTVLKTYSADMLKDTGSLPRSDASGKVIDRIYMKDLINKFKTEVVPKICESYLVTLVGKLSI